jgi:hypothetical protein
VTLALPSLQPHLNSYHHNVSLLFQFILSEFLAVQAASTPLKILNRYPRSKAQCEALLAPISKLAGASHDYMRLFVWNLDCGLLRKLKNYCDLYATQLQYQKRVLQLQQKANQAWLSCMQSLDLLRSLQAEGSNPKTGATFCKAILKLLACLNRISKTLPPLIASYHSDPNVLFFVLRHSTEFDAIYGAGFVAAIFSKMDPEGIKGVEERLIENYSQRGFENLLPIIRTKIARLSSP